MPRRIAPSQTIQRYCVMGMIGVADYYAKILAGTLSAAVVLGIIKSEHPMTDKWKEWILKHRQSDDKKLALEQFFIPLREKLLDRALVKKGETVLDVGTGDGLVAFGALNRVGEKGKVIFSDISEPLLDLCREAAKEMGVLDRCEFRIMSADALVLPDESVDVITTRSVLIYLEDKKKCLAEFYRVLKPKGRISLFEPIADIYMNLGHGKSMMGLPVDVSSEMLMKISEGRATVGGGKDMTLRGFDDRDFFHWAEACGYSDINAETILTKEHRPSPPLDHYLKIKPNPLAPTLQEIIDTVLTESERTEFLDAMKAAIPKGTVNYMALMYFAASKGVPLGPEHMGFGS